MTNSEAPGKERFASAFVGKVKVYQTSHFDRRTGRGRLLISPSYTCGSYQQSFQLADYFVELNAQLHREEALHFPYHEAVQICGRKRPFLHRGRLEPVGIGTCLAVDIPVSIGIRSGDWGVQEVLVGSVTAAHRYGAY